MVVGRVVVPGSAGGLVILTRDWTMAQCRRGNDRCTGHQPLSAKMLLLGPRTNKIYSTNVPGIGMRFSAAAQR
jgi:hypothetical protein